MGNNRGQKGTEGKKERFGHQLFAFVLQNYRKSRSPRIIFAKKFGGFKKRIYICSVIAY